MKKIINVEGYDLYRANIFDYLNREESQKFKEKINSTKKGVQLNLIARPSGHSDYYLLLGRTLNL